MLALTSPPGQGGEKSAAMQRGFPVPAPPSVFASTSRRGRAMSRFSPGKRFAAAVLTLLGVTLAVAAPASAQTRQTGPCDLYAAAGKPCVAAHSTTRALYSSYNGPLYQVTRLSDNTSKDVG